jgi:DNA-binding Xre family transcriptional regulator
MDAQHRREAHVTEVSLEFIAQQIERLLAEQRITQNQLARELTLQREQLRMHGSAIARLNDTITMNILDRLRTLETGGAR